MLKISRSAERQPDIQITSRGYISELYIRKDHTQDQTEESSGWTCTEAFMILGRDECPAEAEVAEEFDDWYAYAADWEETIQKTPAQLQADIEYLAIMTGVELEV